MRKRILQVLTIVALVLGLLLGSGLVEKVVPAAELADLDTPSALMGGRSNG